MVFLTTVAVGLLNRARKGGGRTSAAKPENGPIRKIALKNYPK
jgi:hypothetical protein